MNINELTQDRLDDLAPHESKIKFNIELDKSQQDLIDNLIKTIKTVGDEPESSDRQKNNTENYVKCIEFLLAVKQHFLRENMYMFMTSGFTPLTKIPFYDPDKKEVVEVTMKDIEFRFDSELEHESIPDSEIDNIVGFIAEEQKIIEEIPKEKRKLATAEDIKAARERLNKLGIK